MYFLSKKNGMILKNAIFVNRGDFTAFFKYNFFVMIFYVVKSQ